MCVEIVRPPKAKPCGMAGMCPLGRDLGLNPACSVGWEWAHLSRVTNIPVFTQTLLVTGVPPVVRDSISLMDCRDLCECWSGGNLPLGHFQQQQGRISSGITFLFLPAQDHPSARRVPHAKLLQLLASSSSHFPPAAPCCSEPGLPAQLHTRTGTRGGSAQLCGRTRPPFLPLPIQRCLWGLLPPNPRRGLTGTVLPARQVLHPTTRVPTRTTGTRGPGAPGWGSASPGASSSPSTARSS